MYTCKRKTDMQTVGNSTIRIDGLSALSALHIEHRANKHPHDSVRLGRSKPKASVATPRASGAVARNSLQVQKRVPLNTVSVRPKPATKKSASKPKPIMHQVASNKPVMHRTAPKKVVAVAPLKNPVAASGKPAAFNIELSEHIEHTPRPVRYSKGWVGAASMLVALGILVYGAGNSYSMWVHAGESKSNPIAEKTNAQESKVAQQLEYNDAINEMSQRVDGVVETSTHTVDGQKPRFMRIGNSMADHRVIELGAHTSGIQFPKNIHDIGWYTKSVLPGIGGGSSVVLGYSDGAFKGLGALKAGDTIVIERGSGREVRYVVSQSESMPRTNLDMFKLLSPHKPGGESLAMVSVNVDQTVDEWEVLYAVRVN